MLQKEKEAKLERFRVEVRRRVVAIDRLKRMQQLKRSQTAVSYLEICTYKLCEKHFSYKILLCLNGQFSVVSVIAAESRESFPRQSFGGRRSMIFIGPMSFLTSNEPCLEAKYKLCCTIYNLLIPLLLWYKTKYFCAMEV